MRAAPDVSFLADPNTGVLVFDSFDAGPGGAYEVGGTSLSSPAWAGLFAIADQIRASHGLTPLSGSTQTLPTLYQMATNSTAYTNDFHDVTTGNNNNASNSAGFAAGPGYDLVTGLGTPIANRLLPDLAGTVVTKVNSTATSGTYGVGDSIPITIAFDTSVTVAGTPQLMLNSGGVAIFAGGSGSNTLIFNYVVAAEDSTNHLDFSGISALTLNGGTISVAGSTPVLAADLSLMPPAATGSLGANTNITIPVVEPSHFQVTAPANIAEGQSFSYTVTALAADGAVTPSYTGTVHFTSSAQANLPDDYMFVAGDAGVHTFSATLNTAGNQTIAANDSADMSIAGVSNNIAVVAPISVQGTQVNDGTAQRSLVQSLTVSFDHAVTLDPGAFSIVLHAGGSIDGVTGQTEGTLPVLGWTTSDGGLSYVVTFSGAGVVSNSIADGVYDLRLDSTMVHDAVGQTLATDYVFAFLRLYGDFNGDGTINNTDNFQFSKAFNKSSGQAGYLAFFDFNDDGTINNSDNFQFSKRFNTTFTL